MSETGRPITVLMATGEASLRELARAAMAGVAGVRALELVADAAELRTHLERGAGGSPSLILLDLHLPAGDGGSPLAALKADPRWRRIPVVVLATAADHAAIGPAYDLGASSFIITPLDAAALTDTLAQLIAYWSQAVRLPEPPEPA